MREIYRTVAIGIAVVAFGVLAVPAFIAHAATLVVGIVGFGRAAMGWNSSRALYRTGYAAWLLGPVSLSISVAIITIASTVEHGFTFWAIGMAVGNLLIWWLIRRRINRTVLELPERYALPSDMVAFGFMIVIPLVSFGFAMYSILWLMGFHSE